MQSNDPNNVLSTKAETFFWKITTYPKAILMHTGCRDNSDLVAQYFLLYSINGDPTDFAVHVVDRLIVIVREEGKTLDNAFEILFPSTGRALLFSFLAVFFGFGVLILSQALPLIRFGVLVLIAVVVSFLARITVLPALIKVVQPKFLNNQISLRPDKYF